MCPGSIRPLLLLVLLPVQLGCPGGSTVPAADLPEERGDRGLVDLRWTESRTSRPDWAVNPCTIFTKEGTSCAAQACPAGLISAVLDGKSCTCHLPCNPDQSKRCKPESCGRVCVQLSDSGQPLPGQGACVEDKGGAAGEPCPPVCKLDLGCIAHGAVSFCRQSCTGPADCPGEKMVCVTVSGTEKVCVPQGSTTGPKQGESCAAAEAYCLQGLLCDPQSKICLRACNPSSGCIAPAACTRLVDASGVVIGYGCR